MWKVGENGDLDTGEGKDSLLWRGEPRDIKGSIRGQRQEHGYEKCAEIEESDAGMIVNEG